ncbi:MAG: AMP-binding protein, partial [Ktedonobacteraceae bacterium]
MLSNHEINAEDNHKDYTYNYCVPQLVAQQAASTPGAIALFSGNDSLSYRDLNRRANQLAHHLIELGAGPNVLIACYLERSFDLIIAMLAILKVGGAYVPLDPAYPTERLDFMLADTQAPILLTQDKLIRQLPITNSIIVCLDAASTPFHSLPETNPTVTADVDDLAYVLYTSGSTGHPKGVQISHRSLLNLIFWHQQVFDVTAKDKATQVASPAFDATGWEVWPNLTIGASVTLIDKEVSLSPVTLRNWFIEQHITISFLPTALAE